MTATESTIRDELAANLSILEPGLALVKTEYTVRVPGGTGGRLDILARDELGLYVVIEVKRSDQTAREALHELEKYMGALPFHLRVPAHQIRCMLVSTEWRELRRPYTNFKKHFPHALEGIELEVDEAGRPIRAATAELAKPAPPPELREDHSLLLFDTAERRAAAMRPITRSLRRHGLVDAFVLVMDYSGEDERVVHRFAAYLVYYELPDPEDEEEENRRELELADDVDGSADAFATSYEELLLCRVLAETRHLRDDLETGSPRKLGSILIEWKVVDVIRLGDSPAREVASDQELVDLAAGVTNAVHPLGLKRYASPRIDPDWRAALGHVRATLGDEAVWRDGAQTFLETVARELPTSKVSIAVHVVDNLLFAMREQATHPHHGALPFVEIVAETKTDARALVGALLWDGATWPAAAAEMLEGLETRHADLWGLGTFGRMFRRHTDEILTLHGLRRGLIEYRVSAGAVEASLVLDDGGSHRAIASMDPARDYGDWFDAHAEYFRDLATLLSKRVL
jgi:hypothetical protein